jgi:hydroxyacylglutathione hydrolase
MSLIFMKFKIIPVTPFSQNCSVLWCEETLQAVVVDPGGDIHLIQQFLNKQGLTPSQILLTHGHIDHVGGTTTLAEALNVPIIGPHIADKFWLDGLSAQSRTFGFPHISAFVPQRWLNDGDEIKFGNVVLKVLHCPGHTPGHVVFYHQESALAIVGDVLFQGSIGRTDFPQGDYQTLIRSIKEKLWKLGNNVRFIAGHGEMSTFGEERENNPFVGDFA